MKITKILNKIKPTEVKSDNIDVINEIIENIKTESGDGFYFLRYTKTPIDDLRTGFSAPFFGNEPYADTLEKAIEIMTNPDTEDDYFVHREVLEWKDNHDFKSNKIYNHAIGYKETPNTCVPVYDVRVDKYIISPEFGLSAFLIKDNDSLSYINDIKKNFYMDLKNETIEKDWHLFKAKRFTFGDTDNEKEFVDNEKEFVNNSDRIVTMLNASHVCSLKYLNLKYKKGRSYKISK